MDNTSLAGQLAVTPDLRTIGGVYNLAADPKWQDAQAKAPYKYGGDGAGVRKEDMTLLKALNDALDAHGCRRHPRGDLEEIRRVGRIPQQGIDDDKVAAGPHKKGDRRLSPGAAIFGLRRPFVYGLASIASA